MDPQFIESELQNAIKLQEKIAALTTEERLKSTAVIACTLDGYIHRSTQFKIQADHIFLDEAGYANIIKALTLFSTGVPICFLGDHMQLPPVCEMRDSDFQNNAERRSGFLWAQSAIFLEGLFEKNLNTLLSDYLHNSPLVCQMMIKTSLTETFRFGPELASVLQRYVYPDGFGSGRKNSSLKIEFIHASKEDPFRSRISRNEAEKIKALTSLLEPNSFVILTPYTKQVKLLGEKMHQLRNNHKILTVHKSQGQEWNTVILSVVDTGDKWFVDSKQSLSKGLNLVNTAVSRVQERLIIVCDYDYWKNQDGQLIKELLDVAIDAD